LKQSPGQLATVSPFSQAPLPQTPLVLPQSFGQVWKFSPMPASHAPLPQNALLPQSAGQLVAVSSDWHTPLPQIEGGNVQSAGQLVGVSPFKELQAPSPQVPAQSAAQLYVLSPLAVSQIWFPQRPLALQSRGQVELLSPRVVSQVPSPQEPGQSAKQTLVDSPQSQTPLPQPEVLLGVPPAGQEPQSDWHEEQVSPASHSTLPQTVAKTGLSTLIMALHEPQSDGQEEQSSP